MLGQTATLGGLVFWVALESYWSSRRLALELRRAHLRIDNLQRCVPVKPRPTVRVDHVKGWQPEGSWDDDFSGTRVASDEGNRYRRR